MTAGTDKYERIYAAERNALGRPAPQVRAALQRLDAPADVLDLGCGQGRDALPFARAGHRVVAVDMAASGLAQLAEDAGTEDLPIVCQQADLAGYRPDGWFDLILADRVLHMMDPPDRLGLMRRAIGCLKPGGRVLILDEARNIPALRTLFDPEGWDMEVQSKTCIGAWRTDG